MHWYSSGITLSRSPTQSPTTTTTTTSSSSCCSAGRTDKKNESIHWAYQAGGLLSETVPNLNQSQPPHCPSDCSFPDSRSRSLFVPRFFSHTHEETNFIWGGEMFRLNRLQQSLIHCLALSSSLSRSFPSRSAEHVTVVIHRFPPPHPSLYPRFNLLPTRVKLIRAVDRISVHAPVLRRWYARLALPIGVEFPVELQEAKSLMLPLLSMCWWRSAAMWRCGRFCPAVRWKMFSLQM